MRAPSGGITPSTTSPFTYSKPILPPCPKMRYNIYINTRRREFIQMCVCLPSIKMFNRYHILKCLLSACGALVVRARSPPNPPPLTPHSVLMCVCVPTSSIFAYMQRHSIIGEFVYYTHAQIRTKTNSILKLKNLPKIFHFTATVACYGGRSEHHTQYRWDTRDYYAPSAQIPARERPRQFERDSV